jgi:hypothetical protein
MLAGSREQRLVRSATRIFDIIPDLKTFEKLSNLSKEQSAMTYLADFSDPKIRTFFFLFLAMVIFIIFGRKKRK